MPTAFLRSPADELSGMTGKDKLRKRRRGLLLQEDGDQDQGYAEGRVGPERRAPNQSVNRNTSFGSHPVRPQEVRGQDTMTGLVGQGPEGARDTVAGGEPDASGQFGPEGQGGGSAYPASTAQTQEMSEGEVQSAVHKMVWDAVEYVDQELSPFRALATKYYQGEPFGNEEEGRSQVVITTLRDTILMMLPSLMRVFFGAERAVEYMPLNSQQVAGAEQATEYVWDVVIEQDNRGFLVFYEWFKDALNKRLGIVKYWYDKQVEIKPFHASFLQPEAVQALYADPEIVVDDARPTEGTPPGVVLFDVDYTQTKTSGKIRVIGLPPEEFIFTRGARTTADDPGQPGVALFVGHRTELTRSQLLAMGISEDDINAWAFKDVSLDHNQEEIARQHIVKPDTSAIGPIATQRALYIEGYPYMDCDGDGIAELRRICMLGPAYHVISNEPCDERPFAVICPDPEPHTIIGQGVSDQTMDLQRMNSMIWRSMLDSLALTVNPRIGYVEGNANLNDILNPELGAPIRMRSPDGITPIEHAFVGQNALPVLDKVDEIRENRTGVTKASAGLDADALQSTAKVAAAAQITASQAHIELIARAFAEMGVAPLFRGLLKLLVANPPAERLMKMRGEYVPMDPRAWDANLGVKVKVAIGAGLDDTKYAVLAETAQKMEGVFQTMGFSNPLVTVKKYRDVLVRMLKLRGQMDADVMWNDVDPNWQPPPPPVQDPNMVIAQAEAQKAQAEVQKKQMDAQLDQAKHELEIMRRGEEAKQAELRIQLDHELEIKKLEMQWALQLATINAQNQTNITVAQLKAEAAALNPTTTVKVEKTNADGSGSKVERTHKGGA